MKPQRCQWLFRAAVAMAVALATTAGGSARADDAKIQELIRRLDEQQKEIEALRSKVNAPAPVNPYATEAKEAEKKINDRVDSYLKEKEAKKKAEEDAKAKQPHRSEEDYAEFGLQSLWNSMTVGGEKRKWYEKLNIRGYTQVRYGRTVERNNSVTPQLFGDRAIDGATENFSLRRVRLILFGDVTEHLGIYIQPDFASNPDGAERNTFFAQLRDCYGDVYLTTDKVHRLRVGLSKVPYGFENLQSSQNRVPLDRTEAINTGVAPNERDLGAFYYWTPEYYQDLFRDLVDGGLKGSGNYGIFGIGVYNGQGGSQFEQNRNLHAVARLTLPYRFESGQVIEASVQAYTGEQVVFGSEIRRLGRGDSFIPAGTRDSDPENRRGIRDERIAGTFVVYPQPFGFQCEWQAGNGPGLSPDQSQVQKRHLSGGYVMGMYKYDSQAAGIFIPYVRWEKYEGGYRNIANAPFGKTELTQVGLEWQIWKGVEWVGEYTFADRTNTSARDRANTLSYRNFDGNIFRMQMQLNY